MTYFTVSVAYTAANFLLSSIIYLKSSKNQIVEDEDTILQPVFA